MKRKVRYLWNDIPFLRILPAFICGLAVSEYLKRFPVVVITAAVLSILFQFLFRFLNSYEAWKYKTLRGFGIQILLFLTAPVMLLSGSLTKKQFIQPNLKPRESIYRYVLSEDGAKKTNHIKSVAGIYKYNGESYICYGKAVLYYQDTAGLRQLEYGTVVLSMVPPQPVRFAVNPGEFDYGRYLSKQGIEYQVFLKKGDAEILSVQYGSSFFTFIFRIKRWLLNTLKKYIHDAQSLGLAEALLTGYRNDVDQNLLQAYVNTGVVHVIAISGLHLGLIFLILSRSLGFILKGKSKRYLQPIIVIAALWTFTFISGASASVVRSAVMFSLFSMGNMGGRKSKALNTLMASAFLLLAVQPQWLTDVGFQLSYFAVAGILLLHKKLTLLYPFTNFFAVRFWEMICLTLAAQIFTAPLLLFYFYRFPLLFLFTNLVAVPLSSLILIAELLLCVFSFSTYVAEKTGYCIDWLIRQMNKYVVLMDNIPNSNIENAFISVTVACCMYVLIFSILQMKRNKVFLPVLSILFSLIIISLDRIYIHAQTSDRQLLAILHSSKHTTISIVTGRRALFLTDSLPGKKEPAWLLSFKCTYRINSIQWKKIPDNFSFMIPDYRILYLCDNSYPPNSIDQQIVEAVLLAGGSRIKPDQIHEVINPKILIADASNPLWKIQKWKKDAERLHLRFHSVPEQGAFLLNRSRP